MRSLGRAPTWLLSAIMLVAGTSACSNDSIEGEHGSAEEIDHDQKAASGVTCGGGVFEYEGTDPSLSYGYSVKDGAEILVSLGHRIGFKRLSQSLGLGDDPSSLREQFQPGSYDLKSNANKAVVSTAYLLGQYARSYCVAHPLDTLADAIDALIAQLERRK